MPELVAGAASTQALLFHIEKKAKTTTNKKLCQSFFPQKIPDLFKATCRCGCISLGFSILIS